MMTAALDERGRYSDGYATSDVDLGARSSKETPATEHPRSSSVAYPLDPLKDSRHREAASARELADWLKWLELEDKAARTIDCYEQSVAVLLRAFPTKRVTELEPGDLMHVLASFPVKGRATRRSQINAWFEWMLDQGLLDRNPMRRVPVPKYTRARLRPIFTDIEIALLEGLPAPDGPLMAVLFGTGIRRSEALALQARHVDFENQRLLIYQGKGRKDRAIPLRRLLGVLHEWFILDAIEPTDFLWYTRPAGRQIRRTRAASPESFGAVWWPNTLKAAGISAGKGTKRRTPHSCRHTFATRWLRRGGSLERLSLILGHASIKTTMDEYVHLALEDVAADLELVEG